MRLQCNDSYSPWPFPNTNIALRNYILVEFNYASRSFVAQTETTVILPRMLLNFIQEIVGFELGKATNKVCRFHRITPDSLFYPVVTFPTRPEFYVTKQLSGAV